MILINDYVEVEELKDDLLVDGMIQKYDEDSPYLYARVVNIDTNLGFENYGITSDYNIVLTRRISKIPVNNHYFVHIKDVLAFLNDADYKKLLGKED